MIKITKLFERKKQQKNIDKNYFIIANFSILKRSKGKTKKKKKKNQELPPFDKLVTKMLIFMIANTFFRKF